MNTRSGHYVQQSGAYRTFIPKKLPPKPPVQIDDEMLALLSQADHALGKLDGSTDNLPNPDLFVFMYVRKEAVLSSQIEGTQASLMDILEFEAKALEHGAPPDVAEVSRYVNAMNYGLDRLKKLPLCLRVIREIHQILLTDVRGSQRNPGEFRKVQNWVGPKGAPMKEATYIPPPVPDMLKALQDLEKFLHDTRPMPTLLHVGLVHAQFETIHPFLDGNARVGRLLSTFMLCEREILKRPLLYLSYYFKENRSEYYQRLQSVRDEGDWEGWLKFFLRGVRQVAQECASTARGILDLREHDRQLIAKEIGRSAGKALAILESLFLRPIVSVDSVTDIAQCSFANANNLVSRLCHLGILSEMTGRRRYRRFSYSPYLALFTE